MFKRKLELEWYLYLQSEWDDYNFCDMKGRFRGLNNHRRCWEKKASKESAKYVMSFCEWMAEKAREIVKALRATREGKLWLWYRSKCWKELKRLRYGSTRECWKYNEQSMWHWGGFKNKNRKVVIANIQKATHDFSETNSFMVWSFINTVPSWRICTVES